LLYGTAEVVVHVFEDEYIFILYIYIYMYIYMQCMYIYIYIYMNIYILPGKIKFHLFHGAAEVVVHVFEDRAVEQETDVAESNLRGAERGGVTTTSRPGLGLFRASRVNP